MVPTRIWFNQTSRTVGRVLSDFGIGILWFVAEEPASRSQRGALRTCPFSCEQVTDSGKKGLGNKNRFESESMGHFKEGWQSDIAAAPLDSSDLRLRHAEKLSQLNLRHFLLLPLATKLPYYIYYVVFCHVIDLIWFIANLKHKSI
jgi:hypothetical protein